MVEFNKVWFVTGASSGFGKELVKLLLLQGYQVAATSRNKEKLIEEISKLINNNKLLQENFLPLSVDLLNPLSIKDAMNSTISKFKRLDVVVNNAGYSQCGAFEEVSDSEMRNNFEVNVFAPMSVLREAIPHLRESAKTNKLGPRVIQISSIAGFAGMSYLGPYSITKFALDGISETLAFELRGFGIRVTSVRPGFFRTNFLKDSYVKPQKEIELYNDMREAHDGYVESIKGNELSDPEKGMQVIIDVAQDNQPPLYLFLGEDAYKVAGGKLNQIKRGLDKYKNIAYDLTIPESKL